VLARPSSWEATYNKQEIMSFSDHQQHGADAKCAWRAGSSSSRSRTILNAPLKMTTSGKGPKQALARGKVLAGV
jgi:hypothetical protein